MVKHIVIWRVSEDGDPGRGTVNAMRVKRALESLNGLIPGLVKLEVGIGIDLPAAYGGDPPSSEIALYSEFSDRASLEAYRIHPAHRAVVPTVRSVCSDRRSVDYED